VVLDIAVLYSRSDNGIDLPFAFNVCVLILLLIIIVFQIHKKSNLKKSLLQSSKLASIGEVASGIAHEINNPLTIISGHVNKLELKNKENSEIQSSSAKIKKQIQRITKIINGLRSFSRDTSNESVHLVDIVRVINNSVEFCSDKLKELDIVLKFEFVGDVYVECNEIQIEQVLVNLINNSCDAIFHLEKKWIEIKLEQQNNVNNGYLMYVDTQSNSFTLKKVNLNTGIEFGEEFIMRSFDKSSFTRTAEKLGSGIAPTFGDAEISAESTSDGAVVSFDCACQNVPIKYYIYEIENEIGQKTYVRFFGKNYILGNDIMYTEQNKIRGLEKGKYFLHVYAVNSFNKVSDEYLTTEFTVK
jgi:hypothetical protein